MPISSSESGPWDRMESTILIQVCRITIVQGVNSKELKKEHNLTACSFWLFIGDLGSTTGSNLIPTLKLLFTK